jgi:hypothetical protein
VKHSRRRASGIPAPCSSSTSRTPSRETKKNNPAARHYINYAELLNDTRELVDRTEGPLTDPGSKTARVLADVVNKALRYVRGDE